MSDVQSRIVKVTAEKLGVNEGSIQSNSSFADDLGADSLDLVELVMGFEEEFGVEIDDETSERVNTIQDAIDIVNEKLG